MRTLKSEDGNEFVLVFDKKEMEAFGEFCGRLNISQIRNILNLGCDLDDDVVGRMAKLSRELVGGIYILKRHGHTTDGSY